MMREYTKLIFDLSVKDRLGYHLPKSDVDEKEISSMIPEEFLNDDDVKLPEISEVDLVRHYTNLATKNYGVDTGMYPLGSCTMKYNPKINEDIAALDGYRNLHPEQIESSVQGALQVLYEMDEALSEIAGMDKMTFQPAAGAHGEITGILLIRAYHEKNGDGKKRNKIIVPDSAHGTNPATTAMAGYKVVEIKSTEDGLVDVEALKDAVGEDTAGLMLTNPNTLGLFERDIREIADIVHEAGGLLYYDGANANAILGHVRPGDMGFDVMHFNIHKTFSTPHGGGGPGSGPVAVKSFLKEFLPAPTVEKEGERYYLNYDIPNSIGRVKDFYGHFGILVRAYTYILSLGAEGLYQSADVAVLNANYLRKRLEDYYVVPFDVVNKHEVVFAGLKNPGEKVRTLDVAKRLIDKGYHPPTVYFPLIVKEAMMIEPAESESKDTLDAFAEAMIEVAKEAVESPELLLEAPHTTEVRRPDETKAAIDLILKYEEEV